MNGNKDQFPGIYINKMTDDGLLWHGMAWAGIRHTVR